MIQRPDLATLKIPKRLQHMAEEVERPVEGFFGPDSMFWKVSRENSLLLVGASAALLQLAHPMVAAGVAKYSDFDKDPFGRFHRTFQIVYKITFGNVEEAIQAGAIAWHIHSQINGALPENAGAFQEGHTYNANQPDLLLWVHATLIQQAIAAYEAFVAPLSDDEKARYYEDTRIFGQLFGIPEETIPPDLPSFYEYFDDTVEHTLGVAETGMKMRRTLLNGFPQALGAPFSYLMAGAFLPPKTRGQFELPWNWGMEQCFKGVRASVHATLPMYPARLRYVPEYLHALKRVGAKA